MVKNYIFTVCRISGGVPRALMNGKKFILSISCIRNFYDELPVPILMYGC